MGRFWGVGGRWWRCYPGVLGGGLAGAGVMGAGVRLALAGLAVVAGGAAVGQVTSTQAPSQRARPWLSRLRRFTAAVRRLSQALFLAVPR